VFVIGPTSGAARVHVTCRACWVTQCDDGGADPDFPGDAAALGCRWCRPVTPEAAGSSPVDPAESELAGWSLLGWPGPFTFVGQVTIINPDGKWLPQSLEEVDGWIDRLTAA
jgi:hypothetical protein